VADGAAAQLVSHLRARAGVPVETNPGDLVLDLPEPERQRILAAAMAALGDRDDLSARRTLSRRQVVVLVGVALALDVSAIAAPVLTAQLALTAVAVVYAATVAYRLLCLRHSLRGARIEHVSDEDARAVPDTDLPRYTVLVAAYEEAEVIPTLLQHLQALNYPRDQLEVLILLEEDDSATLAAVRRSRPASYVRVVVVPPGEVRTKPRACNYGLSLATGSLVTIYDAEDQPEPLQLRRAAVTFARSPERVACLQARLEYYNAEENMITRWFTAEYVTWFHHFLPGLPAVGGPIPLGGTSNHFRADTLRAVGGWDPYNVTEDADLGIRLARLGYRVANLDSVTYEEANSDFVNWVKQRSRWYKGYLQTWFVHMRHPRQTLRDLGWPGLAGLNLFVGGTPLLAVVNPLLWVLALLWLLFRPAVLQEIFTGPVGYAGLVCGIFGNLAVIYMGLVSVRASRRPELLLPVLLVPVYWAMMALAVVKAVVQLVGRPSYWEKTTHGLSRMPPSRQPAAPATAAGTSLGRA
jgi:cellulose synthase/poly-beta-1,6-N-acetylglucosamine synthase-like glycosyltransferase